MRAASRASGSVVRRLGWTGRGEGEPLAAVVFSYRSHMRSQRASAGCGARRSHACVACAARPAPRRPRLARAAPPTSAPPAPPRSHVSRDVQPPVLAVHARARGRHHLPGAAATPRACFAQGMQSGGGPICACTARALSTGTHSELAEAHRPLCPPPTRHAPLHRPHCPPYTCAPTSSLPSFAHPLPAPNPNPRSPTPTRSSRTTRRAAPTTSTSSSSWGEWWPR